MAWRYPVPKARNRAPTNNCFQPKRWNGTTYSAGRKAGTKTWVPMHGGSDVKPSVPGRIGENVYPVRPGRVIATGNVWGRAYGKQVLMRHRIRTASGGVLVRYTFYAHLHRITCAVGDYLQTVWIAENKIGDLGATGTVENSHVHFAYQTTPRFKDGVLDPFKYLEAARVA